MRQRMMKVGAAWLAAALLASAAAPLSAYAQPSTRPVDPLKIDHERARRAYQKGNLALRQGRYADAEAAYLEAWSIVRAYDIAANLGLVALKLHKPREAAERLDYSLRAAPLDVDRKKAARVQEFLAEAKQQIGTLQVPPLAPGIALWVDGENIKPSPLPQEVFVEPGTHQIRVQREGYVDSVVTVEARPGSVHEVSLALVPLPPPAPPKASVPAPRPVAPRSDVPLLAMGAMSAAWLGAGVGLTIVSNSAGDEAGPAAASRCSRLGAAAGVSYVMSGALVLGAVAYALWPDSAPVETGNVRALPVLGANGAGLTLQGEW